jgi:hypothetical protein
MAVVGGALALILSLFLPYAGSGDPTAATSLTGYEAYRRTDVILVVAACLAIAIVAADGLLHRRARDLAGRREALPAHRRGLLPIAGSLGFLALGLTAAALEFSTIGNLEVGYWLALASGLSMVLGFIAALVDSLAPRGPGHSPSPTQSRLTFRPQPPRTR